MSLPLYDFRFDLGDGWEIRGVVQAVDKVGAIIKGQAILCEKFPLIRSVIVAAPQACFSAELTVWRSSKLIRFPHFTWTWEKKNNGDSK